MEMFLKEEGLYWGRTKTASCLHLLLMAAKRDLLPLMDVTPQSQAPVTQVSNSVRLLGNQKDKLENFIPLACEGSLILFCLFLKFFTCHSCIDNFTTMLTSGFFPSCIEPTTSRASLNFQEYVLSRPPLSRSHLHFPPLDASSPTLGTSSLFSQPSTSSAPGPFSTGFSLVKEIKDNLSQHEDDNISTTSGFSSRASDKGKEKIFFAYRDMRLSVLNGWGDCIDTSKVAP